MKQILRNLPPFLALAILAAGPVACQKMGPLGAVFRKKPAEIKTPAQLYNEGLFFMARRSRRNFLNPPDYEKARDRFQEIMYNHPTSRYAPLAELRVADTYYETGDYEIAATSYDAWRKNHVGRSELPYVTYRIAMSYYHQLLSVDRDQTSARLSLMEFQFLVGQYPRSEYAAAVGDKMDILKTKLAKHELYVGKFYFRHKHYWAAVDRFQGILKIYPSHGLDETALYWSWKSYVQLGRFDLAQAAYQTLGERFPNGELTRRAKETRAEKRARGASEWLAP